MKEPIEEGYFSKLTSLNASRPYPARVANATLSNVHREGPGEQTPIDVDDLIRSINAIRSAIEDGYVVNVSTKNLKRSIGISYYLNNLL